MCEGLINIALFVNLLVESDWDLTVMSDLP